MPPAMVEAIAGLVEALVLERLTPLVEVGDRACASEYREATGYAAILGADEDRVRLEDDEDDLAFEKFGFTDLGDELLPVVFELDPEDPPVCDLPAGLLLGELLRPLPYQLSLLRRGEWDEELGHDPHDSEFFERLILWVLTASGAAMLGLLAVASVAAIAFRRRET